MSKFVEYELTHGALIVELKFITIPRKGWFALNIKPVVEFLKATIPANDREYNGLTHKWSFSVRYWGAIQLYLKSSGFTISEKPKSPFEKQVEVPAEYAESFYHENTASPTGSSESVESIAKQLSSFLGVVVSSQELTELKKLYRQKARELHPDFGGSAEKMSELNRLWTLYCNTGVRH